MARALLRLLLGSLLAATVLGAIYLLVGAPLLTPAETVAVARNPIARGFVGVAAFGRWRLICAPEPAPLLPPVTGPDVKPANSKAAPPNQCRINQEVAAKDPSHQVILAANLSVIGPAKRPALMLRLPPTARDGDVIVLRADDVIRARAVVHGCAASECVAAGDIAEDDWAHLLAARALLVSFPAANRQPVLVDIATDGLADAARAMTTAQTVSR